MATSILDRRSFGSRAPTVALRLAGSDEGHMVRRLAALDDQPALEGPVLLALVDGEAVAALSLHDRRVVANPFLFTRDLVQLLRLRAEHIAGPDPRRGRHGCCAAPPDPAIRRYPGRGSSCNPPSPPSACTPCRRGTLFDLALDGRGLCRLIAFVSRRQPRRDQVDLHAEADVRDRLALLLRNALNLDSVGNADLRV